MKPPHNVAFLDRALRALSETNEESVQLRRVMANVIVGQFMDGAVMRGGGSLKLRYGLATTRYTMDFDAARNVAEEAFVDRLMMQRESVDMVEVRRICKRLFANRKKQSWPPKLDVSDEWRVAYAGMLGDIPVLPTVDEAVDWTNKLISEIDRAE